MNLLSNRAICLLIEAFGSGPDQSPRLIVHTQQKPRLRIRTVVRRSCSAPEVKIWVEALR